MPLFKKLRRKPLFSIVITQIQNLKDKITG
jgi:hypothetical protein